MELTPYLTNIVIVDFMRVNLFPQSCTTHKFVASNAAQAKERNYHDRHLISNCNIWMCTQISQGVLT
jgi:hypothetical protein